MENKSTGRLIKQLTDACVYDDIEVVQVLIPKNTLKASPLTFEYILRSNAINTILKHNSVNVLTYLFDEKLSINDLSFGMIDYLRIIIKANNVNLMAFFMKEGLSRKRIISYTLPMMCYGDNTSLLDYLDLSVEDFISKLCPYKFVNSFKHMLNYYLKIGLSSNHFVLYNLFPNTCELYNHNIHVLETICALINDENMPKICNAKLLEFCVTHELTNALEVILSTFSLSDEDKLKGNVPADMLSICPLGPKFSFFI